MIAQMIATKRMYIKLSRMSFFKKFPLYLFLVSYFCFPIVPFFSEWKSEPSGNCSLRNSDYFLSLALNNQSKANQANYYQDKTESQKYHNEAILNFEKYLECTPSNRVNPMTHLNMANSYLEVSNLVEAEKQGNLALQKNPYFRDGILFQARLLTKQGKLEEASQILEKKIPFIPEDSDFLFLLGSLNRELGKNHKSILYYTSLLDSIQKREGNGKYKVHVLKNLADLYYQVKDLKKSLVNYQAYLILNPRDMDSRFQVAQILSLLGDFGASKKILLDIHEKNPSNSEVELLLAEMYYVDSKAIAYPYFTKLKQENKLTKDHLTYTINEILNRNWTSADLFLRDFLPNHANRIAARLAWLEVLEAKYNKEDLAIELKVVAELSYTMKQPLIAHNLMLDRIKLQEKNPSLADDIAYSYWFLANCMEELKSPNRAILYSKKAIALAKSDEEKEKYEVHLGHILLSEKIKRPNEGISIADRILAQNPKNHSAFYLKSYALFQKENYETSMDAINLALEIDSENVGYIFHRSLIYEKLKNFEAQEKDLKTSIQMNSENPVPLNYLGFLYAERNEKKEEALNLILQAVELEPDNGAYQDSLGWIYFRMNRLEESLFHLTLAKQMMADSGQVDPIVMDHFGDVFKAKDDIVNAKEYWKKAFQISKNPLDRERIQKKISSTQKGNGKI